MTDIVCKRTLDAINRTLMKKVVN